MSETAKAWEKVGVRLSRFRVVGAEPSAACFESRERRLGPCRNSPSFVFRYRCQNMNSQKIGTGIVNRHEVRPAFHFRGSERNVTCKSSQFGDDQRPANLSRMRERLWQVLVAIAVARFNFGVLVYQLALVRVAHEHSRNFASFAGQNMLF
nr:hypothetical protein [Rosistilla oblonga]